MSEPRKEMTAMPQQTQMQTPKKGGLNVFSDPNGFAVAFNMASNIITNTTPIIIYSIKFISSPI